jgi:hypothetical protein
MKHAIIFLVICLPHILHGQQLQLHYELRHTTYPELNPKNYPSLSFEYFKNLDSARGSFLVKVQADLNGRDNNVGQTFLQLSQTLRFWKPKVELALTYSGGLGTTPSSFGFYINNAFGVGAAYPFQWKGGFFSTSLVLRYNAFDAPSYDPQFTFYFGKGFRNYKIFVSSSFTFWTQNNNLGNEYTKELRGKSFRFFGDPQIWYRIKNGFSVGTRIYIFYHVVNDDIQFYPTIGTRYQF